MTFAIIQDSCIRSESCIPECPVGAIVETKSGEFVIDPSLCIDCEQCLNICPTDAIVRGKDASAATLSFNKSESAKLRKK